jgi:hypothetical protein
MGKVRCALAVRYDAGIDEDLLRAVAEETGREFSPYGSGMFGTEVLATLYSDASGGLLIEAEAIEVPVKAVLVWTEEAEHAVAVRQVVGDRLRGWSEQMIRGQIESEPDGDPQVMVALAMATGGGPMQRESVDLLQRAAASDDERVCVTAEYALRVAADLQDPPVVKKEAVRELPEVLRSGTAVDGPERWVTARAGVGGRQIPRPVTWLRGPGASGAIDTCSWDGNWHFEVAGQTTDDWYEDIWTAGDACTAVHVVEHPALGGVHIAVHGADVDAVVATLRATADLELLDAAPAELPRTAA